MAAKAKYPAAHEQLLALGKKARARGLTFAEWWEEARRPENPPVTWATPAAERPRGAVVWPRDTTDRNISIAATDGAREGWQRAYEKLPPTKAQAALKRLAPDGLGALVQVAEDRADAELAAAA